MLRISLLVLTTFIWGAGFVATRWTFIDYSEIWSNSLRYVFAGLICIPILLFTKYKAKLYPALLCSFLLMVGLQLQTIGIKHTTLAKSGFLTTFYAIFTPILCLIFFKSKFRNSYWFLVGMAFVGISFLCDLSLSNFNKGDTFILLSALFFSLHIIAVDQYTKDENPVLFNCYQCLYMGIMGLVFALSIEDFPSLAPLMNTENLFIPSSLLGFIILAVFSSIIAFSLQIYAQQGIPPHIVSLIFLMESIFSSAFGYIVFNETMTPLAIFGGFLVVLSVALIPVASNYKKATT